MIVERITTTKIFYIKYSCLSMKEMYTFGSNIYTYKNTETQARLSQQNNEERKRKRKRKRVGH